MPTEAEAKFLLCDATAERAVLRALRAAGFSLGEGRAVEQVDRYWDTAAWDLWRQGWACRWRQQGAQRTVELKALTPADGLLHRREEAEVRVDSFPAPVLPLPLPALAARLDGRAARLKELFRVETRRRTYIADGPHCQLEVCFDRTAVVAAGPVKQPAPGRLRFDELEIELRRGDEKTLRRLAKAVRDLPQALPARLSKFERGLQAAGLQPPPEAPPPRWPRADAPLAALAYPLLAARFAEMRAEAPRAWEGLDPEGVHQMRVATRRLRAALRAFAPALPATEAAALANEFRWLTGMLGRVRDMDGHLLDLEAGAGALPPDRLSLQAKRQRARLALLRSLQGRRYARLQRRCARFLEAGAAATPPKGGRPTIAAVAGRLIDRRLKRILRAGRALGPQAPDADFHALRIQCKKLRYLFESFAPAYGARTRPLIKRLKVLQDVLGDLQDASVAEGELRACAAGLPLRPAARAHLLDIGRRIGLQHERVRRQKAGFAAAWRAFDRKGTRRKTARTLARGKGS